MYLRYLYSTVHGCTPSVIGYLPIRPTTTELHERSQLLRAPGIHSVVSTRLLERLGMIAGTVNSGYGARSTWIDKFVVYMDVRRFVCIRAADGAWHHTHVRIACVQSCLSFVTHDLSCVQELSTEVPIQSHCAVASP